MAGRKHYSAKNRFLDTRQMKADYYLTVAGTCSPIHKSHACLVYKFAFSSSCHGAHTLRVVFFELWVAVIMILERYSMDVLTVPKNKKGSVVKEEKGRFKCSRLTVHFRGRRHFFGLFSFSFFLPRCLLYCVDSNDFVEIKRCILGKDDSAICSGQLERQLRHQRLDRC